VHHGGIDGAPGVEVDVDQEVVVAQLLDQRVELARVLVGCDQEHLLLHGTEPRQKKMSFAAPACEGHWPARRV
jgi:hypothetical protein